MNYELLRKHPRFRLICQCFGAGRSSDDCQWQKYRQSRRQSKRSKLHSVERFHGRCQRQMKAGKTLINPLRLRITPSHPHECFPYCSCRCSGGSPNGTLAAAIAELIRIEVISWTITAKPAVKGFVFISRPFRPIQIPTFLSWKSVCRVFPLSAGFPWGSCPSRWIG